MTREPGSDGWTQRTPMTHSHSSNLVALKDLKRVKKRKEKVLKIINNGGPFHMPSRQRHLQGDVFTLEQSN